MINETDRSQVAEFSVFQLQHALLHFQQFGYNYNFKFILDYFKKIHMYCDTILDSGKRGTNNIVQSGSV